MIRQRLAAALGLAVVVFCATGYSYNLTMDCPQTIKFPFPTHGRYRTHTQVSKEFKSLYEFEWRLRPGEDVSAVKVDKEGNLAIDGEMLVTPAEFRPGTPTERREELTTSGGSYFVDVVKLKFISATLQLENNRLAKISFETEAVDGISYSFDGKFPEKARLENGSYVELVGKMKKLKAGRKEEANLKFLRWAYE